MNKTNGLIQTPLLSSRRIDLNRLPAEWPQTTEAMDEFFLLGEGAKWFLELPSDLRDKSTWELLHMFKVAVGNTRIALAVETRAQELQAALDSLAEKGLSVEDLVAYDRTTRGSRPFAPHEPDYVLPAGYKRSERVADTQGQTGAFA